MEQLSRNDWSPAHAAHLLRRAAFSGCPAEVDFCYKLGLSSTVAILMMGRQPASKDGQRSLYLQPAKVESLPHLRGMEAYSSKTESKGARSEATYRKHLFSLQLSWIDRMLGVSAPREKMALFWHGMLVSSYQKVGIAGFIVRQNGLFRQFAFGDYRKLVKQIAIDPAMIIYLDIDKNQKKKPNENFAREVLELFTLGEGNYKSEVIKKIAKQIVGYRLKFPADKIPIEEQAMRGMEANSGFSDLSRRIDKVIDQIFSEPVCGELLCRRLWKFYVSTEEPDKATIRHLAKVLRKARWRVSAVLEEIFLSKEFYSPEVMGQQIKSPVQLLVQSYKEMGATKVDTKTAFYAMNKLGQSLFNPPNVAGWPAGETWINGSTLSARYELCTMLVDVMNRQKKPMSAHFFKFLKQDRAKATAAMFDHYLATPFEADKARLIVQLVKGADSQEKVSKIIEYMMCMPEYQLC